MKDFQKELIEYRKIIDKNLTLISESVGLGTMLEPVKYALESRGKRLRPILLILVGKGFGAEVKKLLPAATAIEILHTFTLVHDDIMDNDSFRRGRETIHKKWDVNTAILAGDALMSLAFGELTKTPIEAKHRLVEELSNAMLEICDGQKMDMEFEGRVNVTKDEYLQMIGKKTGRLLSTSCKIGGMIASIEDDRIKSLESFGRLLGIAFQIQDDLLEIVSSEQKMGKSLKSDLKSGKKTFLVVDYLEGLEPHDRENFIQFLISNADNKELIVEKFSERGTIDRTVHEIKKMLEKAKEEIADFPGELKEKLYNFIDYISNRQS